jgi:hypothetical protein
VNSGRQRVGATSAVHTIDVGTLGLGPTGPTTTNVSVTRHDPDELKALLRADRAENVWHSLRCRTKNWVAT